MRILSIIGSAGRRDDAPRMGRALYDGMHDHVVRTIADWDIEEVVSGGAAFADHLAVRAFLEGHALRLRLFLPAAFDGMRFVENPRIRFNPGKTLNHYHFAFSRACGVQSLAEIGQAVERGAQVEIHEGFHRRNLEVAAGCTHMLAFTFGADRPPGDHRPGEAGHGDATAAGLRDGGTSHTFGACWRAEAKRHVSLTWLERNLPGPAEIPRAGRDASAYSAFRRRR